MSARVIWIVVIVVLVVVGSMVALIGASALALFAWIDRTDAHVCGLAAVRRNQAAIGLLGTPISQQGWTGGSSNDDNGVLTERITFDVKGPNGKASVVSEGKRAAHESHLVVTLAGNSGDITVYDGPFDCPEIHAR